MLLEPATSYATKEMTNSGETTKTLLPATSYTTKEMTNSEETTKTLLPPTSKDGGDCNDGNGKEGDHAGRVNYVNNHL